MPTGIALRDVRAQLFDAAERVLLLHGPSALTSRAVTTEAGVAKGVLHRHFTDFDDFLAALISDRSKRVSAQAEELLAAAGTGTVVDNLTTVLTSLFTSVAVGIMSLIIFRDELRARLKAAHPSGIPLLSTAGEMISSYLVAERTLGRLSPSADIDALGLALIGSGHLLFAARSEDPSGSVSRVVAGILAGSLR
ncbi:TetR/AcrR family transcriptional regulator [Actinoplanes sp. NPDC051343]|uniref:TetR/AcrR family transcriptional regulator n=1 Tax=Actinoplanes sp. NPDC051343 TaxID=3363906 RepID=UPI0037AC44F8